MADGKVFWDSFGNYINIQIEWIKFFKREAAGLADCQHNGVFIEGGVFVVPHIQFQGNNNINKIGITFIKFSVCTKLF